MATKVGSRQQAGGGKKNCAEPVYCATCKTVELSPPDWTQFGGGGVCRDCERADDAGIAAFDPEATPRGGTLDASGLKKLPGEWHLSVDGQFQAAQRTLTKLERDKLRDDLRVRGCLDPLIAWHDEGLEECGRGFPQRVRAPALLLVDGHHRYQLCAELGLPVAIQTVDMPDRTAVLNWMRDHQLGRRNLSPDERDALLAADYAAVAKPRGGKRSTASKDHSEPLRTEESRIENREAPKSAAAAVAEKHGVSEATVKRAVRGQRAKAKLAEKAPEQAAEVKALPRATAIAKAEGKAAGSRQQAVGSRKAAISFTGANREKANDMLAAHLALFPVSARYEQSGHLLDAINAWRGQHFVGPTRNGKPRPR